jgi:hypothetical protein
MARITHTSANKHSSKNSLTKMSKELTTIPTRELAPIERPQNQIAMMLQGVIEKGITKDNAEALSKLAELYEKMESKNAEREFNTAFVKLQSELPVIVASSVIPNRGRYERYEDVWRQVSPMLNANGFSVSYSQAADEKRITVTCKLSHISGYSQPTSFSVRLGGRADSETQADCKASTTAKRNALLQALNIVIRQDFYQSDEADSAMEGSFITASQAADLRALCEETKSDKRKFLEFAGAETFETIMSSRLTDITDTLNRKRAK